MGTLRLTKLEVKAGTQLKSELDALLEAGRITSYYKVNNTDVNDMIRRLAEAIKASIKE